MAKRTRPSNVPQVVPRSPTQRSILHMWGKDGKEQGSTPQDSIEQCSLYARGDAEDGGSTLLSFDVNLAQCERREQRADDIQEYSENTQSMALNDIDAIPAGKGREEEAVTPKVNQLKEYFSIFQRRRAKDKISSIPFKCEGPELLSCPTSKDGYKNPLRSRSLDETPKCSPPKPLSVPPNSGGGVQEDYGTSDRPIVISSPPAKKSWTPMNGLSSTETNRKNINPKKQKRKVREGGPPEWPGSEAQHTRGPQKVFSCVSKLPLKISHLQTPGPDTICSTMQMLDFRQQNPTARDRIVEPVDSQFGGRARREAIIQQNPACRAISRFRTTDGSMPGMIWNDRWRPRSATEVLGNESSTCYMKDWLLALGLKAGHVVSNPDGQSRGNAPKQGRRTTSKISNHTKQKVIRTVERPCKRRKTCSDASNLSDWITDDEESDGEHISDENMQAELASSPSESDNEGSPWNPRRTRLNRKRPAQDDASTCTEDNDARTSVRYDFSDRLTNTILLAGPTGSGKTAAVYACAEELGWEVFEVYPGIGKRNGASLLSLVGDVSRNHLVRSTANTKRNSSFKIHIDQLKIDVPDGFSEQCLVSVPVGNSELEASSNNRRKGGRYSNPDLFSDFKVFSQEDCKFSEEAKQADLPRTVAQQSIILLEEVDVLFSEDVNFWPTVVTLIRESRRPVIMTCNDPKLVPIYDLPLQTTLFFRPCSLELAATYLECLALTEGYSVSRDSLKALYESRRSIDELDLFANTMHCTANDPLASDLRRAINCLQFLCESKSEVGNIAPIASASKNSATQKIHFENLRLYQSLPCSSRSIDSRESNGTRRKDVETLNRLWRSTEALSVIDSELDRAPPGLLEIDSEESPYSDDQLGYCHLPCSPRIMHLQGGNVLCNKDRMIMAEALLLVRTAVHSDDSYTRPEEDYVSRVEKLIRARRSYCTCVAGVLDEVLSAVKAESTNTLMLEYEPWVRFIDQADSALEAALVKENEMRLARGGRLTRNSQRMHYERYLNLDESRRKEWWEGALVEDRVDGTLSSTEQADLCRS